MKTGLLRQKKSRRPAAAHATLSVLALAGAIGVQGLWKSPTHTTTESWRLYIPALLVITTAWLLATAWLHFQLARRATSSSHLLLQALADLGVAVISTIILAQGHTSLLALTGLWPIAPLLLAIGAPSAVLLLAIALASRSFRSHSPQHFQYSSTYRFITVVALLISLSLMAAQPLPKSPEPRTINPQSREAQNPKSENLKPEI